MATNHEQTNDLDVQTTIDELIKLKTWIGGVADRQQERGNRTSDIEPSIAALEKAVVIIREWWASKNESSQ